MQSSVDAARVRRGGRVFVASGVLVSGAMIGAVTRRDTALDTLGFAAKA